MSTLPSNFPSLQRNGSSDSDQSFLFLSSPFNDKKRIIILDWDDTFLPTSYLLSNPTLLRTPYHQLPSDLRASLSALETVVLDLILKLIKLDNCHCYIVSNAMNNWILFSCQTYFPTLFNQVFHQLNRTASNGQKATGIMHGENSSLMIYSACELFARQCPNQRGLWKLFTFTYIADSKLLIPEKERQIAAAAENQKDQSRETAFKNNNNKSNGNGKKTGGATPQLKWIKPETPRRENSKSKSRSQSQSNSKSSTVSTSDTVSCQEEESERRQGDFDDEIDEQTITINDEEYDGDNVLPPLFETGFEDEMDQFELEQAKDSLLLDSMFEKSEWELMSIGDAEYEATAALQVGCTVNSHPQLYRSVTTKVVKMPRLASVSGMTEQLRLLQDSLPKLLACEYSIFVDNFEALLSEE